MRKRAASSIALSICFHSLLDLDKEGGRPRCCKHEVEFGLGARETHIEEPPGLKDLARSNIEPGDSTIIHCEHYDERKLTAFGAVQRRKINPVIAITVAGELSQCHFFGSAACGCAFYEGRQYLAFVSECAAF
jgi:hypothetical protein